MFERGIFLDRKDYKTFCKYWSYEDYLQVQSDSKIDEAKLLSLLNTTVYAASLNDWQREVVDRNYNQLGDIIIPEIDRPSRKLNLSIEKEDKKVYLKKM